MCVWVSQSFNYFEGVHPAPSPVSAGSLGCVYITVIIIIRHPTMTQLLMMVSAKALKHYNENETRFQTSGLGQVFVSESLHEGW